MQTWGTEPAEPFKKKCSRQNPKGLALEDDISQIFPGLQMIQDLMQRNCGSKSAGGIQRNSMP